MRALIRSPFAWLVVALSLVVASPAHAAIATAHAAVVTLSAAVQDKTGIFGPVVDRFWPVIATFLVSLTVKLVAIANKGFAKAGEPVKWAALYFAALGWNLLAKYLDLATIDPTAPVFAVSFAEMAAAGLIYKFAGHKVPTTPTTA